MEREKLMKSKFVYAWLLMTVMICGCTAHSHHKKKPAKHPRQVKLVPAHHNRHLLLPAKSIKIVTRVKVGQNYQ